MNTDRSSRGKPTHMQMSSPFLMQQFEYTKLELSPSDLMGGSLPNYPGDVSGN